MIINLHNKTIEIDRQQKLVDISDLQQQLAMTDIDPDLTYTGNGWIDPKQFADMLDKLHEMELSALATWAESHKCDGGCMFSLCKKMKQIVQKAHSDRIPNCFDAIEEEAGKINCCNFENAQ